jgi:hypothetical protein
MKGRTINSRITADFPACVYGHFSISYYALPLNTVLLALTLTAFFAAIVKITPWRSFQLWIKIRLDELFVSPETKIDMILQRIRSFFGLK